MARHHPMKTSDSMAVRVEEYLQYRRTLGYALRTEGGMLLNFARFADQSGHRGPMTRDLAIRWARLPAKAKRIYWAKRIEALIGFARYCQIFDSRTEIPPKHIFGPAHQRMTPYIYTPGQLGMLVVGGDKYDRVDGMSHLSYATVFGLLACTGLRISEALQLHVDDVDLKHRVISVRESKCRRLRLVPLHRTAIEPLRNYARQRDRRFPGAAFFFVNRGGDRLRYSTIRTFFRKLTVRLGWVKDGNRPRIHDLRHTFACRVLLKWRRRKAGQEDRIDWLSHYLGHERVSDTYWYFSATPQLFATTAKDFKCPMKAD